MSKQHTHRDAAPRQLALPRCRTRRAISISRCVSSKCAGFPAPAGSSSMEDQYSQHAFFQGQTWVRVDAPGSQGTLNAVGARNAPAAACHQIHPQPLPGVGPNCPALSSVIQLQPDRPGFWRRMEFRQTPDDVQSCLMAFSTIAAGVKAGSW